MNLEFSIYNIIVLLGGIQGVILSVILLFSKKEHRQANRFLAMLIFIMGFTNLHLFAGDSNFSQVYNFRVSIPYIYLGIGPSLYFYAKSLTNLSFTFSRKDVLHFIPVTIECFYYLSTAFWMTKAGLEFHYRVTEPFESTDIPLNLDKP